MRKNRALSQEDVAEKITQLTGEEVGQAAVSHWELGKVDMRKVHPRRLRAYAEVLGISTARLAEITGYAEVELFPETAAFDDPSPLLPDGLLEAAELYGDRTPALRNPRILQQLAAVRHWDGGPRTAQDWLDFYLDNRRRFQEN